MNASSRQPGISFGHCQNPSCYFDASVVCKSHSKRYCANGALFFHPRCSLKVQSELGFLDASLLVCQNMIKDISGVISAVYIKDIYPDAQASLRILRDQYSAITSKISRGEINVLNVDDAISDIRYLVEQVFTSQAFHDYTHFSSSLKISNSISTEQVQEWSEFKDSQPSLTNLLNSFKKQEIEFREKTIKNLITEFTSKLREVNSRVTQLEQSQSQGLSDVQQLQQNTNNSYKELEYFHLKIESLEYNLEEYIRRKIHKNIRMINSVESNLITSTETINTGINKLDEKIIFIRDQLQTSEEKYQLKFADISDQINKLSNLLKQ